MRIPCLAPVAGPLWAAALPFVAAGLLSACSSNDGTATVVMPPVLADPVSQTYEASAAIEPLLLTNNGGGGLTSCGIEGVPSSLPAGLAVGRSPDGRTCAITGMPSAVQPSAEYIVVAINASGSSRATVTIEVVAAGSLPAACGAGADAANGEATFKVSFHAEWSAQTTGVTPPGSAHFTTFIGGTHNSDYVVWASGSLASSGVESMAETGSTSGLESEVRAQIAAEDAGQVVKFNGVRPGTGMSTGEFTVTCAYPLVSFGSMVAPSPDWFVGVSSLSMLNSSMRWHSNIERELFVYDAGTEDGDSFSLSNPDSNPKTPIKRLVGNANIGLQAGMDRIGRIVFERTQQ